MRTGVKGWAQLTLNIVLALYVNAIVTSLIIPTIYCTLRWSYCPLKSFMHWQKQQFVWPLWTLYPPIEDDPFLLKMFRCYIHAKLLEDCKIEQQALPLHLSHLTDVCWMWDERTLSALLSLMWPKTCPSIFESFEEFERMEYISNISKIDLCFQFQDN